MNENQDRGTAISVYGQEGLDDFPVLKAFQQYIDAEQSKAPDFDTLIFKNVLLGQWRRGFDAHRRHNF